MSQSSGNKAARSFAAMKDICDAIADDLYMLASLHEREPDKTLLRALHEDAFPDGLGLSLLGERAREAQSLMKRALETLPEDIGDDVIDELAADYANIYLNHGIQASPEESVWVDDENLICQESMFQVRAWYGEYGLISENWRIRPDDHLVLQLQFIARLFSVANSENNLREIARFMDEHLLRWLGRFAERVAGRCATDYFAAVALLSSAYCDELRSLLAVIMDEPVPSADEIEERMNPRRKQDEVPISYMPGMGPVV